jgi:hypothetical protein
MSPSAALPIAALMVAQAVPGVVAVDVNALHRDLSPPALEVILVAASGRRAGAAYQAAELLLVAPGGIALSEMPR